MECLATTIDNNAIVPQISGDKMLCLALGAGASLTADASAAIRVDVHDLPAAPRADAAQLVVGLKGYQCAIEYSRSGQTPRDARLDLDRAQCRQLLEPEKK